MEANGWSDGSGVSDTLVLGVGDTLVVGRSPSSFASSFNKNNAVGCFFPIKRNGVSFLRIFLTEMLLLVVLVRLVFRASRWIREPGVGNTLVVGCSRLSLANFFTIDSNVGNVFL